MSPPFQASPNATSVTLVALVKILQGESGSVGVCSKVFSVVSS